MSKKDINGCAKYSARFTKYKNYNNIKKNIVTDPKSTKIKKIKIGKSNSLDTQPHLTQH